MTLTSPRTTHRSFLVAACVLASWISFISTLRNSSVLQESLSLDESIFFQPEFTVTNEYSDWYNVSGAEYGFGVQLVEPYRVTTLSVSSPSTQDSEYHWEIMGGATSDKSMLHGLLVEITFTETGRYNITLQEKRETRFVNTESSVICRYVRREIRSLCGDELDRFFNTLSIMYRTPWAEGQALYGNVWRNAGVFTRDHNTLAGQRECDHMHDGLGFLTLHGALTLDFEKAMQLVDPMLSMPYWDFTIDSHAVLVSGTVSSWYESQVFDDDWFGSVWNGASLQHVLETGRWAFVSVVPSDYGIEDNHLTGSVLNGLGFLRAPWNTNDARYLTRHNQSLGYSQTSPPSCEWHANQLKFTEWALFAREIQYEPHGKIHSMVSGMWGSDQAKYWNQMGFEHNVGASIALSSFGFQKDTWRKQWMDCPSTCSSDATDSCKCTCGQILKDLQVAENREMAASEVLQSIDGQIFNSADSHFNVNGDARSFEILELMCDAYNDTHTMSGDLGNSGAPIDPIFWPIHPTIDRLWHWRRLNGFTDENWPSDSKHTYFHEVYSSEGSVLQNGSCYGHAPEDVMIWRNLFDEDDHYYTNSELYSHLNPASEDLPYVYDNFRWPHCAAEGFSIDLLDTTENNGEDDSSTQSSSEAGNNLEKHDRFDRRPTPSSNETLKPRKNITNLSSTDS